MKKNYHIRTNFLKSARIRPLETPDNSLLKTLLLPGAPALLETTQSPSKKINSIEKNNKKFTFQKFFINNQQGKLETIQQSFDYLLYSYDKFEDENIKENAANFRVSFKSDEYLVHAFNKKKLPLKIPYKDESSISLFSLKKLDNTQSAILGELKSINENMEIDNDNENESLWFYNKGTKNLIEWDLNENKQKSEMNFNSLISVSCLEIYDNQIFFAIEEAIKGFSENTTIIHYKILTSKLANDHSASQIIFQTDHAAPINVLMISKKGKMMVSSAKDFSMTIWESENNPNSFKKIKFLILDYKKYTEIVPFIITDKEMIYSPSIGKIKFEKTNQLIARAHAGDITCFLIKNE